MMRFFFLSTLLVGLLMGASLLGGGTHAHADATSDLQAQIDAHNAQIKQIEDEIAGYQKTLDVLGSAKQTLQTTIKTIDVSRSQTTAQISATNKKISAANLQLKELALQIGSKELAIKVDQATVANTIRTIAQQDGSSMIEQLLSADDLGAIWNAVDTDALVSDALRQHAATLANDKQELDVQNTQVSSTKGDLTSLNSNLTTQKQALDANRQAKSTLLTQTQNQESNYQSLIAKKKAEEQAFETELNALESQLSSVGQSSIPHIGQGILAWPYSVSFAAHCLQIANALDPKNNFCITQYFGNTPFASANPSVYNGAGHNGIDIGMPIGTPVQAALSGTVLATGNTDLIPGCYSFGKWVMINHANGLSTLYAHLSSIQAVQGQAVSTGDVIGLSGMTGYATGPHLHFGVYATAGVQILTLQQFRGATTPCANARMPVAPLNAYLNPISYL